MPIAVTHVPSSDPWAPYKDLNIWEFTEEELRKMPDTDRIIDDERELNPRIDALSEGWLRLSWRRRGRFYIRFVTEAEAIQLGGEWIVLVQRGRYGNAFTRGDVQKRYKPHGERV